MVVGGMGEGYQQIPSPPDSHVASNIKRSSFHDSHSIESESHKTESRETESRKTSESSLISNAASLAPFCEVADKIANALPVDYSASKLPKLQVTVGSKAHVSDALKPKKDKLKHLERGLQAFIFGHSYLTTKKEIEVKTAALAAKNGKDSALQNQIDAALAHKKVLQVEGAFNLTSLGLTGVQYGANIAAELVINAPAVVTNASQIVQGLAGASGAAGMAVGVVGIGLTSRLLHRNRKLAEQIPKEKIRAEQQLKTASGVQNTIIDLRVRNLDKQQEGNRVSIVANSIALSGSILGTTIGTKVLLVALGVSVGVAAGAALATLGIAAAVLGGVALAIGIGYLVYKNRHAIQHAFRTAYMATAEHLTLLKIKILDTHKKRHREEIRHVQEKLAPEIRGSFSYKLGLHTIKQRSQNQLDSVDRKIVELQKKVALSVEKRKQIKEAYNVGQHQDKFAEGPNDLLQELYNRVKDPSEQDLAEIRTLVDVKESAKPDEVWDALIQYMTAPVMV